MRTARASTTARGYGWTHTKEKARWRPTVNAGRAYCTEPICLEERDGRTRWINPRGPWDLAHDRTSPGQYHGPAHSRCNRSEGATYGNQRRTPRHTNTRTW